MESGKSIKKEASAKIKRETKLQEKELKRLMKQLGNEKMPTLMYQTGRSKRPKSSEVNPW